MANEIAIFPLFNINFSLSVAVYEGYCIFFFVQEVMRSFAHMGYEFLARLIKVEWPFLQLIYSANKLSNFYMSFALAQHSFI